MRTLFEYPDIISEHRMRFAPSGYSVYTLSMQLTEATKRLRQRGSLVDRRNKGALCPAAQILSDLYREPSARQQDPHNPTLFEVLERSIYHAAHDTARESGMSDLTSERLADLSHRYVEVVQRACLAEFVLADLIGVEWENVSALGVARREVVLMCGTLGFLERDPKLHEILQRDVEKTIERLQSYRETLDNDLSALAQQLGVAE